MKKGAIVLFDSWHGKPANWAGSSRIRGRWIMKYWPQLDEFVQGRRYSFVIFQKCYWPQYAEVFQGPKVLDLCDPDWLVGQPIKNMVDKVDAVTCSTEALANYIRQMTDKPVWFIPDRQDLEFHKKKKIHKGKAKSVVWFGYAHNGKLLDVTIGSLKKLGLKLTAISELRPPYNKADENIKWDLDTINDEILKHDIVLMPQSKEGRFAFKSNNKITKSWALGMPVATNPDELKRFIDPEERKKEAKARLKEVKEKWDIRLSVKEYKQLIKEIRDAKK